MFTILTLSLWVWYSADVNTKIKKSAKPGPKPQMLEPFNGTFEAAVDRALKKKPPAKGWSKAVKK
jgi:hypothetical protein